MARRGKLCVREHAHEGLVLVGRGVGAREVGAGPGRHVDRRKDPAVHWNEVGREAHGDFTSGREGERLLDLGRVPMLAHLVGLDAPLHLREEHVLRGVAPRAGNAGFCVDDDRIGIDESPAQKRRQREDRAGRVAAGARHEARLADRFAMKLRKAVHRLLQQVGALVLPVGRLIDAPVVEPVVGREVDHLLPCVIHFGHGGHGRPVGKRSEDDIGPAGQLALGERVAHERGGVDEAREDLAHGPAVVLLARDRRDLNLGMNEQDPEQLKPRVAARAGDGDLDHLHDPP